MKKFVFVLIGLFSFALTSCSWFDNPPIEPEIIGIGNLQYDEKNELWFVTIDSVCYTITEVTIAGHSPHIHSLVNRPQPFQGMQVTVFTSPHLKGIQAVTGKQTNQNIKKMYHTDTLGVMIILILFMICIKGIAHIKNKEISQVNADV